MRGYIQDDARTNGLSCFRLRLGRSAEPNVQIVTRLHGVERNQELKTAFIYFLRDPRTGKIRYVGWTYDTKRRFRMHLRDSLKNRHTHKEYWICSLLQDGFKPILQIVEEVVNYLEREIYWISKLRSDGHDLVNSTDGGDGSIGLKYTPERLAKAQITLKRINTPEAISKFVEMARTRPRTKSERTQASERMNKFNTEEKRAAQSARIIKQNNDPQAQANKLAGLKKFLTPEKCVEIGARFKAAQTPEVRAAASDRMRLYNENRAEKK